MEKVLITIGVLIGAYLLGSIPIGLLVVRVITGEDIRTVGSGRTGGTNSLRAAGLLGAVLTILGDAGKGWLAVWIAHALTAAPTIEAVAGLLSVVGHNYSAFIGFSGGAGTMTTIGSAIGLWPWSGAVLVTIGGAMIGITHRASLGSIAVALLTPVTFALRAWLAGGPWVYLIHGIGTAALTLWALRPNIRRIREGQERRVRLRKTR